MNFKIISINKNSPMEQTRIEAYENNKLIEGLIIDAPLKELNYEQICMYKAQIFHNVLRKKINFRK